MLIRTFVLLAAVATATAADSTLYDVVKAKCPSFGALASGLGDNSTVMKRLTQATEGTCVLCPSEAAAKAFDFVDVEDQKKLAEVLEIHVTTSKACSGGFAALIKNFTKATWTTLNSKGSLDLAEATKDAAIRVTVAGGTEGSPGYQTTLTAKSGFGAASGKAGGVFVIESVLVPVGVNVPADSAAEELAKDAKFAFLEAALEYAKLTSALGAAPTTKGLTILAPTNEAMVAFAVANKALPAQPKNGTAPNATDFDFSKAGPTLADTLKYHVLTESIFADQFPAAGKNKTYSTLDGKANVTIAVTKNATTGIVTYTAHGKTSAKLVAQPAAVANNAVIYQIDAVLSPSAGGSPVGLTTGAIVAIVIGSVAGLICIAALVYNFTKTRRENMQDGYGALDA